MNVLNDLPTTSLASLKTFKDPGFKLTMESTAACIMAKFDALWVRFLEGSGAFEPFMEQYMSYWLHTYVVQSRAGELRAHACF